MKDSLVFKIGEQTFVDGDSQSSWKADMSIIALWVVSLRLHIYPIFITPQISRVDGKGDTPARIRKGIRYITVNSYPFPFELSSINR